MGLDMYLTKKIYIGANYEHRDVKGEINIKVKGVRVPVNFDRVSEIVEEVGYWRKSNQIHKWFVDNVQEGIDDCKDYFVSPQKFKQLLADINAVLSARGTSEELKTINEFLPTADGFFFGDTDVDQWYWDDLERTKKIVEAVIQEQSQSDPNMWESYYYHSSW